MSLADRLAAADPLVHERPLAADAIAAQRQTVLRHATEVSASPGPRWADIGRPATWRSPRLALTLAAVIVAMLVAGWSAWRVSPALLAAVRLEIRLAEERPAPGLSPATVLGGSNRTVYLHGDVIITNEDVARARIVDGARASRFNVDVRLTPVGAAKLQQATTAHIGRPIALLIDGQVVMAPVVRSPIGEAATITGDYTREEAERIAAGLMTR